MAGFSRVKGSDRGFQIYTISSLALAVGDLVAFDRANEVVVKATSSTTIEDVAGVVVEATTTADTEVLTQRVIDHDEYIVDVTNNSSADHNYHRMLLTDENEVNNTGTDDTTDAAVFMQLSPVGAASEKKIRGRFVTRQDRAA
jgi:hypothetical protein